MKEQVKVLIPSAWRSTTCEAVTFVPAPKSSTSGGNAQILEQVRHLSWIAAGRSPGDDDREWSDRPGADVDDGPIHVVGVPDVLRQYLGNLGLVPVGGEGEADLSLMYSVEGFG